MVIVIVFWENRKEKRPTPRKKELTFMISMILMNHSPRTSEHKTKSMPAPHCAHLHERRHRLEPHPWCICNPHHTLVLQFGVLRKFA